MEVTTEKNLLYFLPSEEEVESELERIRKQERILRPLRKTSYAMLVVAAVAILLSCALMPIVQISGESMAPTLHNNEVVVVLKSVGFERGDLICFSWNNQTLLKRVIAGPGDWLNIDDKGTVYINGEPLDEPYVTEPGLGECDTAFPVQISENKYWVMGDNRISSIDSRSSLVGTVPKDKIIGKVVYKVWPDMSRIK